MTCSYQKYRLYFKEPGGTSRGVLHHKDTYFLWLKENGKTAYGECNLFKDLSYDDRTGYEEKLAEVCKRLPFEKEDVLADLNEWPSIKFGVETVLCDLSNGCRKVIFAHTIKEDGFRIPINGLIWMGEKTAMKEQIISKLKQGFCSIKLKIGAIDFENELDLLRFIRRQFDKDTVELRVDANGAFDYRDAKEKLNRLSEFDIQYIEQPIKAGHWREMASLCETSPVRIALDEELIGVTDSEKKKELIGMIHPQVLVLKPALAGGFSSCDEWKKLIVDTGGEWVITSALESNIGLNAIAQYAARTPVTTPQGLGTGQLFVNNFPSPYTVDANGLQYHTDRDWNLSLLG